MKIKKGDKVKVISGKHKTQEGVVEKVLHENNKLLITGVNIVSKHVKASKGIEGGILKINRPIHASNVMLICPKTQEPTRIGYQILDGKKVRISKKSKQAI